MAHRIARPLPDMLLGVKLRAAWRKMQRVNMGVLSEIVAHHFPFVPLGPIPQDQQRTSRIGHLHMIQEMTGHVARLRGQGEGEFMTGAHVQPAIEMDVITLRSDADGRGLTTRCPHAGRGRLKVQAHLIDGQNNTIGMILDEVGHFFSSSASKSATRAALGCER